MEQPTKPDVLDGIDNKAGSIPMGYFALVERNFDPASSVHPHTGLSQALALV